MPVELVSGITGVLHVWYECREELVTTCKAFRVADARLCAKMLDGLGYTTTTRR